MDALGGGIDHPVGAAPGDEGGSAATSTPSMTCIGRAALPGSGAYPFTPLKRLY